MTASNTVPWQSEEAVAGVYLTAVFKFPGSPQDHAPVAAIFSYTNAGDDFRELFIPLDGSRIPVQFVFRNRMSLQGKLWVVYFNELPEGDSIGVSSDLSFGFNRDPSNVISCQGVLAAVPVRPCPVPPPPPPPPPSPECPCLIVEPGLQAVPNAFPYIFLRKWSPGSTCECCLLSYLAAGSPPQDTLYEYLLQAVPFTWTNLQGIVDLYLSGSLQTGFPCLSNIHELEGPITKFHQVYRDLRLQWPCEDPLIQVLSVLGTNQESLEFYLASASYAQNEQRCWQNYFALVIKLGYRMDLLEQLAETLLGAFIIEWVFLDNDALVDPLAFKRHLDATIVLPSALFPLPPPQTSPPGSPPVCSCDGTAQPFAIGELQLLQVTLVRYQPGDLAKVVNVLAGEKRRHSYRRREKSQRLESEKTASSTARSSATNAEISQLFRQALESVTSRNINASYNGFNVTYGLPATATLNGGWSEQFLPGSTPGDRNLQRLSYDLADRGRTEVSRQVELLRIERISQETENSDTSIIDNTGSNENRTYVYRWLDRIYSAQTYHSGLRLVVRFSIPNPAKDFVWAGQQNAGLPKSPKDIGIVSYEQINCLNYLYLLGCYGISQDLSPPPNKTISAILRLNESKEIFLPEGYQAVSAYVTPAAAANSLPAVNGVIGRETFSFPPEQTVALTLSGEQLTVPVIIMGPGISGSPPEPFPANEFAATVEIECHPSQALMREWKLRVYQALVRAFEERLSRYRKDNGLAGTVPLEQQKNPELLRAVQRQELRRRCLGVLQEMDLEPETFVSPPYPVPPQIAEDFALVDAGFFSEILQWDLMTYRYLCSSRQCCAWLEDVKGPQLQADLSFAQFLQAESAIVLVPANPRHALAALYYLRSGMIWTGPEHLVPVNANDSGLACELKSVGEVQGSRPIGAPWEFSVPTSEQIVVNSLPAPCTQLLAMVSPLTPL